jgi:hypothetical protein
LLCLSNPTSDGFDDFYVMHGIEMGTKYNITAEEDPLLQRGCRVDSLADLCSVAQTLIRAAGQTSS